MAVLLVIISHYVGRIVSLSVCRSVRPSVRPSVHPSICPSVRPYSHQYPCPTVKDGFQYQVAKDQAISPVIVAIILVFIYSFKEQYRLISLYLIHRNYFVSGNYYIRM